MITLIGGVFIAWTALAVLFRRQWLVWALSASVPFAATAAVTFGENSVPPFYIVAAVVSLIAIANLMTSKGRRKQPALALLLAFTVVSLLITFFAPQYFEGMNVLIPREGIDEQVLAPGILQFSTSNIAQVLYLLLGGGVVLYLSQQKKLSVHALAAGFAVGSLLSSAQLVVGSAWPSWVFDNYAGIEYWETAYQGEARLRGIFPEPSYLAVFSLAALCYFIAMVGRGHGKTRAVYLLLTGSAALNVALSYSGTAALGVVVMAGIVLALSAHKFFTGQSKIAPAAMLAGLTVAAAMVFAIGPTVDIFNELFADKADSASFSNRSTADVFSLQLMMDTYGIGVGLGSNRPSSMLAMLASCVGVVGTVLFLIFLSTVIRGAARNASWRPVVWSLVALLVAKFIAEPALSTPLLWFTIGLCIYAANEANSGGEEDSIPAASSLSTQVSAAKPLVRRAGSLL